MSQQMLCNYHQEVLVGMSEYTRHCAEEHQGAAIAVTFLDDDELVDDDPAA